MLPDKALLVPAAFEEHIPSEDAAFCRAPLLLFLETQSDPGAMQAVCRELPFPVCHVWGGRCGRGRSLLCDTEIALTAPSARGIVRGTGDSFSLWMLSLHVLLAHIQK